MEQQQFLDVIDRDEAEHRFRAVLDLRPLESESVPLDQALGRVLAADVRAPLDVPGFDRSDVDGFAVRAEDTFGAGDEQPRRLRLNSEVLIPGIAPRATVHPGTATPIATGGAVPRGASAVVMVEYTDIAGHAAAGELLIKRPVAPGANMTFAGTDIGKGETVLRRLEVLTSREMGVLAALGLKCIEAVRRPRVAILSTGPELRSPGEPLQAGQIYDSNATVLADAVRELGCEPVPLGICPDEEDMLEKALGNALACDAVVLSGGTSKGAGDICYRVVGRLGPPGIVVHGVALKPGKPLCLAAVHPKDRRPIPVVVLPGFPTSAIFTFQEFVAPVLRRLAGRPEEPENVVPARLPMRVNSVRGRTEYLLVGLVQEPSAGAQETGLAAYPMGTGSGSVTTFSRADGFVVIPRQREYLEAGEAVSVHLLGHGRRVPDLVVMGSHCVGLDYLLGRLHEEGFRCKFLAVGSMGGLDAARRGQCDLAGIHLFDPEANTYNLKYLSDDLILQRGYGRSQGIVYRPGDSRFEGSKNAQEAIARVLHDPTCVMVNRNRGSGTRILTDRLLGPARPPGYLTEPRSHNAVAAAVALERNVVSPLKERGVGSTMIQGRHGRVQFDSAVDALIEQSPKQGSRVRPALRAGALKLGQHGRPHFVVDRPTVIRVDHAEIPQFRALIEIRDPWGRCLQHDLSE